MSFPAKGLPRRPRACYDAVDCPGGLWAVNEKQVQRRLAAILAADVAGYSRLVGADEERTIARLRALPHELIAPADILGRD